MKESTFAGVGGLKVFTRSWQPEGDQMFRDRQPDLITAPAEPNVAAVLNIALRWSANSI
jgi:hypothetical protein